MVKKSYTFENFCVGEENKIAYLAAQRIIEMPGALFNPLYIYAGVGLGKTHLLGAIGHAFSPKVKTRMVSGLEYIEELKKETCAEFKKTTSDVDCFILDDLHVLENDPQARTEFSLLLEHLLVENHQVVVSANVLPGI